MGEQVPQRDGAFAAFGELGDVARRWIVESDESSIDEDHDARRGRDRFGERGQIEDGVFGHRDALGLDLAHPIGLLKEHAIAAPHRHDAARELDLGYRGRDEIVDDREPAEGGLEGGLSDGARRRGGRVALMGRDRVLENGGGIAGREGRAEHE
jgi:hypothetical protein